jgi:single-stranded DNA-binding protein
MEKGKKMASNLNSVTLSVTLTHDPFIQTASSGKPICHLLTKNTFYDANDNQFAEHEVYANITLWDHQAAWWSERLHQGDKIIVIGKLVNHDYKLGTGDRKIYASFRLDEIENIAVIEPVQKK